MSCVLSNPERSERYFSVSEISECRGLILYLLCGFIDYIKLI